MNTTSYYGEKCGHHYFVWKITDRSSCPKDGAHIIRSCILLPLLCEKGIREKLPSSDCIYTSIADDYTEIDANGKFVRRSVNVNDFLM